eukprot:15449355-Alexandrium_andersonii.AAC.1
MPAAPASTPRGGLGGRRMSATPAPAKAVDLARAMFAPGATPGEVRATVAEISSPPRITATAERNPRSG